MNYITCDPILTICDRIMNIYNTYKLASTLRKMANATSMFTI